MAAEFKIGRLRFIWRGTWAPATFYNRDAVIHYQGKAFVCIVPNTSASDFYDDLNATPFPKWELIIEGTNWSGPWEANTAYSVGDIVIYGGRVYNCSTPQTSATFDSVNWTQYAEFDNWNIEWSNNYAYGIGDIVKYGGVVYKCTTDHVSALSSDKVSVTVTGATNNANIISVTDASGDGVTVTLTYGSTIPTPYSVGQTITVSGVVSTSDNYNGTHTVLTASSTQVTFLSTAAGNYTSGGTITGPATTSTFTYSDAGRVPFSPTESITISGVSSTGASYNGTFTVVSATATQLVVANTAVGTYTSGGSIIGQTSANLEKDIGKWAVFNRGVEYKGNWVADTRYKVNDLVKLEAAIYKCTGYNSDKTFVPGNWTMYLPGLEFAGVWASNITYQLGDVVSYGGYDYTSIVSNNVSNVPSTDATDWLLLTQGYEVRGEWASGIQYKIGDVVRRRGRLYDAIVDNLSQDPTEGTVSTTYTASGSSGTTVKVASTTGIVVGMNIIGVGFSRGQRVVSTSGSTTVTLDREPDGTPTNSQSLQFTGVNSAYWSLLVTGNSWAAKWQPLTNYYIGDLVTWKNATYVCTQNNNSSVSQTSRPDLDVTNQFWTVYVLHYLKNALNDYGDIETYDNDQYSAVPIGTSNYVLRSTDSLPTWTQINKIPNVFYVAPTGIDGPDHGRTWDEPWKTIRYACQQVTALRGNNIVSANLAETVTIFVKTGEYPEVLPIVVPATVAIVGDELRGTVVKPATSVITTCTASDATTDKFTVDDTTGMVANMPVQFDSPRGLNNEDTAFGGVTTGQTYYIVGSSITATEFGVSNSINGIAIGLTAGTGSMKVYAGDSLKNMFLLRDGTGLRNMTLSGLMGTLAAEDEYTIQRPTGGAYASLDPGIGPNDSSTWITKRSPYVQNVTTFGKGAVGLKIDGTLHAGGNRSMVANDYTQIISDGIGVWCTGSNSLTECISVFCYFGYSGYFAENGGRIRAANGNSSYGTYGVIAEGFDTSETPISGTIYNQSQQTQAQVQSAFGTVAQILRLNFSNAGSNYFTSTTNLLGYSNNFTGSSWTNDGFVSLNKIYTAPTGIAEAWSFAANSATPGANYLTQNISVTPTGATYSGLSAVNIPPTAGTDATFNVTVTSTQYIVTVANAGGTNYVQGDLLYISGSQLGGVNGTNDCTLTVSGLAGSSILTVTPSGTVPAGSAKSYTVSVYVKSGTGTNVTIGASFTGSSTKTSLLNYNFVTGTLTASATGGGFVPVNYGAASALSGNTSSSGWYRLWFATNDVTGLNNNLQFQIYPLGTTAPSVGSYNYFYGGQVELSRTVWSPSFYLETFGTSKYTSYANYNIIGAGTGVITVGDELRSNSVFQTRVIADALGFVGGSGYLTASNNAQSGTDQYVQLAGSDVNTNANYTGMRVFINSGVGAGQYGYISYYDSSTKNAYVLKESFEALNITGTTSSTNVITLNNNATTDTLYLNMPVQFIPTYYTTSVTSTSLAQVSVTATTGGQVNTLTVSSTSGLSVNMAVVFSGNIFTSVNPGTIYYIKDIIDENTITITEQIFGNLWLLNTGTGNMTLNFTSNTGYLVGITSNMVVNYPIQFTGTSFGGITVGTTYYINDIISATGPFNPGGIFTIANSLVNVTVTATSSSGNTMTVASTNSLVVLNPIVFSAPTIGGSNITDGTKYYISTIIDNLTFTVCSSIITITATATDAATDLITVSSTAGFVANHPIQFTGTTFGGITAETTYYILSISGSGTEFSISQSPGGGALNLSDATGSMIARTSPTDVVLTTTAGSMAGTSTARKRLVTFGSGTMTGTFSTSLFGGVELGTTYYVKTITPGGGGSPTTIQVSATLPASSGSALTLSTKSGSMNLAAVGWDHFNVGTPVASELDYTSVYFIEPRTTFSDPNFTSSPGNVIISLAPGTSWSSMAWGNNLWMALPNGNATGATSVDGSVWLTLALPATATWSGVAYGAGYWVIISSGTGTSYYSNANGAGWKSASLPSSSTWSSITYGNGVFVAIASGTNKAAYSTNNGYSWTASTLPQNTTWVGIAYGNNIFVAIASGGSIAAYSTDGGATWTQRALPRTGDWTGIAYGNNLFHIVSATSGTSAYTFDGITWYSSNLSVAADKIAYGNGIFLALKSGTNVAWTTEGGQGWVKRIINNTYNYGAMAFGFSTANNGTFSTLAGQSTGVVLFGGARTKGRATITSGTITAVSEWEPGANYSSAPTVTFTDPNVTTLASVTPRLSSGVLSSPSMVNKGNGYNTNSTFVTVTGNGFADQFQTGLTIVLNNLSQLPNPGDSLTITGNTEIYKVTSAFAVYGTTFPNLEANIAISPDLTTAKSPSNGTTVSIRSKYSQCRLTNHDFLNIGYGGVETSNYPGFPDDGYNATSQNQTIEANYGRVFYTSTDQDGNFKVGSLFGVQQSTGIVTLSASQFGLTGLETLALGGISVGGSGTVITQFSTDGTFTANSDSILPTQKAIKTFVTSRLSQGGANTFTGQLTAGQVIVGGPNVIGTTVTNGSVKMANKVNFTGLGAVDGNMAAFNFFIRHSTNR